MVHCDVRTRDMSMNMPNLFDGRNWNKKFTPTQLRNTVTLCTYDYLHICKVSV